MIIEILEIISVIIVHVSSAAAFPFIRASPLPCSASLPGANQQPFCNEYSMIEQIISWEELKHVVIDRVWAIYPNLIQIKTTFGYRKCIKRIYHPILYYHVRNLHRYKWEMCFWRKKDNNWHMYYVCFGLFHFVCVCFFFYYWKTFCVVASYCWNNIRNGTKGW